MIAPVVACPYTGVAQAYQQHNAGGVVSICGPEDGYTPRFPAKEPVLRLGFSDIHCGYIWSKREVATVTAKGLIEPTEEDVVEALRFARTMHTRPVVVHCHAGVSRSPAIALAILADRHGQGAEYQAVHQLYASSPSILPNAGIVALADKVLARQGALIAAAQRARQADDARDTAPFSW